MKAKKLCSRSSICKMASSCVMGFMGNRFVRTISKVFSSGSGAKDVTSG